MRLEGKTAVVTGAGSAGDGWGNGRAAAVLFAREGARVLAVDRDPEALEETIALAGDLDIRPHTADVTDSAAVAEMVRAAGPLDVLVNNVGGSHPGGPEELDEADWDAQLDLNLKSAYLTCRHALPVMRAQGGGAIVNTASTSGIRYTGSPQVAYAAAKAASSSSPAWSPCSTQPPASAPTASSPGSCTRRWSRRGSPTSARAATRCD